MKPDEIFFSHSSSDRRTADRLGAELERHGLKIWSSGHRIRSAAEWHDEIGRALARCDWFLLLLSPASVRSRWVKLELVYALTHSQYDGRISPVLAAPCDYEALSWTLGAFQIIDLERNRAANELLATWHVEPCP